MTPEGRVKNKVVTVLKKYNVYYFFPATGGYGRSGVPDIVACVNGRFVGIECKAGKNKTTALQKRELDRIRASGGSACVVDGTNMKDFENWMGFIFEGTQ
jgi:Holliday junction resolvase